MDCLIEFILTAKMGFEKELWLKWVEHSITNLLVLGLSPVAATLCPKARHLTPTALSYRVPTITNISHVYWFLTCSSV